MLLKKDCRCLLTCAAERVTHGYCATVGVDLLGVQAQLLDAVRRLRTTSTPSFMLPPCHVSPHPQLHAGAMPTTKTLHSCSNR